MRPTFFISVAVVSVAIFLLFFYSLVNRGYNPTSVDALFRTIDNYSPTEVGTKLDELVCWKNLADGENTTHFEFGLFESVKRRSDFYFDSWDAGNENAGKLVELAISNGPRGLQTMKPIKKEDVIADVRAILSSYARRSIKSEVNSQRIRLWCIESIRQLDE